MSINDSQQNLSKHDVVGDNKEIVFVDNKHYLPFHMNKRYMV